MILNSRPPGWRRPAWRPAVSVVALLVALLVAPLVMVLSGCTPSNPSPTSALTSSPAVDSPTATGSSGSFPEIERADFGATDRIDDLATRGPVIVAAGFVDDGRPRAAFRFSPDRGKSWQVGQVEGGGAGLINRGAAHVVAGRHGGWLAIGSSTEHTTIAWTSQDGRSWRAAEIDHRQLGATDAFVELLAVPGGYLLVGRRTRSDGSTQPAVWHSTDGRAWRFQQLPGRGSVNGATVAHGLVVAVGAVGDHGQIWVSRNDGRAWRTLRPVVPTALKGAIGDAELSGVTAWGRGFRAIGTHWLQTWRPLVLSSSAAGRRWTYESSSTSLPRSRTTTNFGQQVVRAGGTGLASVRQGVRSSAVSLSWLDGGRWRRSRQPEPQPGRGPYEQFIPGLVASGPVGVTTVMGDSGRREVSEIWRTADHGRSYQRVELPPVADLQPVNQPTAVTAGEDGLRVTGNSRGLPVVWTVDHAGTVSPPQRLSSQERFQTSLLAAGGGGVLVAGSRAGGNPADAAVWTNSSGSDSYFHSKAAAFQRSGRYAWSAITDAHWIKGRWYVVGERGRDGPSDPSALIASSSDGTHWDLGTAATAGRTIDGVHVDDLRGNEKQPRIMYDLGATSRGWIAVGAANPGSLEQPAVWRSRDGRHWALDFLPTKGFATGQMSVVEVRGSTVIATGRVAKSETATPVPYVWRSSDAGQTWSGSALAGREVAVERLVQTPTGFVVVGADVKAHRPKVWSSTDGRHWNPVAVPWPSVPDRARVALVDVAVAGDDVVGLLRTTTPDHDQTELIRFRPS